MHAEERLELLKHSIDTHYDGAYWMGTDDTIAYVNEAGCKMLGYQREELIGMPISKINPTATPDRMRQVWDVLRKKKSFTAESTHQRKDGSFFPVEISSSLILFGGKEYNCGFARDISERTLAQQHLRESEERYRALFEESIDAIALVDTSSGIILETNKKASQLLGFSPEEFCGMHLSHIDITESEEEVRRHTERIATNGKDIFETKQKCKNGEIIDVEVSAQPIVVLGRPVILAVWRDITLQKKTMLALQKSQKLESLGVLAGGIAHDFNNLLGGIFGYIDLASEEARTNEATMTYLAKALTTIDRARALTRQLLTFARGGAPVKKPENLTAFLYDTVQFTLSGSRVSGVVTVPGDLWPCDIDKSQICQVIDNIVINARQAMPEGGKIRVEAENVSLGPQQHPVLAAGNYVKISVIDRGPGMPKEILSKIFDPFFTTKAHSPGLGLATCYSIIKRHGGAIDVESQPRQGSSFFLYVPALAAAAPSPPAEATPAKQRTGTVLLMDDEEVLRDTVSAMLNSLGYKVLTAGNAAKAMQHFSSDITSEKSIVAAILDLTIPGGKGGKEVAAEMRKLSASIPIFVASGYADDPVMADPAKYGFTASICKPFLKKDLSILLHTVSNQDSPD